MLTKDDIQRHEVPGGWFEVLELPQGIWVMNICSESGEGNRVAKALLAFARERGKDLYGEINQMSDGMENKRLKRWYQAYGGVVHGKLNGNEVILVRGQANG